MNCKEIFIIRFFCLSVIFTVETIDETESRYEKESISSRTGRDINQQAVPPTTTEPSKTAPAASTAPPPAAAKGVRKYLLLKTQILLFLFLVQKIEKSRMFP
jgi:hypothetical protein